MRGEVTMIAGQPNAGKSMFALYLCLRLSRQGERVLYFSADSNEYTQATRLAAILSGHRIADVRDGLASGGLSYYEDILSECDVRLDFNTNPTLKDIELGLEAYDELFGSAPTIVVVDNLMNVEGMDDESEKRGLIEIQKCFKYWARRDGSAFLVLHHCSEAEGKPNWPPARKMIQQKINELPEVELTVAYDDAELRFGVAAVKNRHGKADPGAKDPVWLAADLDRGRFADSKTDLLLGA